MLDSFQILTTKVSNIPVILKEKDENVLINEPLFYHIVKYPNLRWSDLYKFILQGTCGWTHLNKIGNEDHLLDYLKKEMIEAEEPLIGEELFEILEKETKIVRVNLRVWKKKKGKGYKSLWKLMKKLDIDTVYSLNLFKKRWEQLMSWFKENIISCPINQKEIVNEWLSLILEILESSKDSSELPLVSHSKKYREEYKPKYRVIKKIN